MSDKFPKIDGQTTPASSAFAVTPSNTTDFLNDAGEFVPRALYIGVAGDVTVDMLDTGTTILFSNVPVGVLSIRCRKVRATGTTATNITAMY